MTMNSSTRRRELCIFPAFPASGMAVNQVEYVYHLREALRAKFANLC